MTPDSGAHEPTSTNEQIGRLKRRLDRLAPLEHARSIEPDAESTPDESHQLAADAVAQAERQSDTLARTYRGLRLIMIGVAPAIFLAVFMVWVVEFGSGTAPLTLSHYYYSPAGIVFVGALTTAAAALLALSGRGVERVALDIAAMLAPIIALIPTPLSDGEAVALAQRSSAAELTPEQVTAIEEACRNSCVPAPFDVYVDVSFWVWAAAVAATLLCAAILAATARARGRDVRSTWVTVTIAGVLLVVYVLWWSGVIPGFGRWAHFVSASTFLLLLALTAIWQFRSPDVRTSEQFAMGADATSAQRALRITLGWLGVGMAVVLVCGLLALLLDWDAGFPDVILWVEVAALVLFTTFWLLQTVRKWHDPDA